MLGVCRYVADAIEHVTRRPRVRRHGPDVRVYAPRYVGCLRVAGPAVWVRRENVSFWQRAASASAAGSARYRVVGTRRDWVEVGVAGVSEVCRTRP